ncbi:MAG: LuxR C-terminal-related transcriptional regulator [Myxococcota bacterium]
MVEVVETADPRFERLTRRQREVLELLSKGLTNDEIGAALGIGGATVKTHVAALLTVLEVANRTEAAGLVNAQDQALGAAFFARPAVAVLGFEPLGFAADEGATFLRGFVDDLVHRLYRWRWLPVIARASSLAVAAGHTSPVEAGRLLGARYLIHGNVLRDGERYRVTAFLEDASDGVCLWSQRIEARGEGVLDVQEQLAAEVVASACPQMVSAEIWRARRTQPKALGTWALVHRALWHVEQRSPADNRTGLDLVARALEAEPELLPALHVKGQALFQEILNQWTRSPDAAMSAAQQLAGETVRLHPEAPIGHLMRARLAIGVGDAASSAHHAEIATAINPSLADSQALLGQALATLGRTDLGLEHLRRAKRLNPRSTFTGLVAAYFCAGRYAEALAAAQEILLERPRYGFARIMAIGSSALAGDRAMAKRLTAELLAEQPGFRVSTLERIVVHDYDSSQRLFAVLRELGLPD